jgi:hypothetical protein
LALGRAEKSAVELAATDRLSGLGGSSGVPAKKRKAHHAKVVQDSAAAPGRGDAAGAEAEGAVPEISGLERARTELKRAQHRLGALDAIDWSKLSSQDKATRQELQEQIAAGHTQVAELTAQALQKEQQLRQVLHLN